MNSYNLFMPVSNENRLWLFWVYLCACIIFLENIWWSYLIWIQSTTLLEIFCESSLNFKSYVQKYDRSRRQLSRRSPILNWLKVCLWCICAVNSSSKQEPRTRMLWSNNGFIMSAYKGIYRHKTPHSISLTNFFLLVFVWEIINHDDGK